MLCVMCIGLLPRYVNDGTDAYVQYFVRYDIMQAPPFSMVSGNICHAYPTKSGPGGLHTNPPGGHIVTYVGHAWRSIMHPPCPDKTRA